MSTTPYRNLPFILIAWLLQGCDRSDVHQATTDLIDRKAFSSEIKIVSSKVSDSGKPEVQYRLIPYESEEGEEGVYFRLEVGDSDSLVHIRQGGSDSIYDSLWLQKNGSEYRFYYRKLYDRADEMRGKLYPIDDFKHADG